MRRGHSSDGVSSSPLLDTPSEKCPPGGPSDRSFRDLALRLGNTPLGSGPPPELEATPSRGGKPPRTNYRRDRKPRDGARVRVSAGRIGTVELAVGSEKIELTLAEAWNLALDLSRAAWTFPRIK